MMDLVALFFGRSAEPLFSITRRPARELPPFEAGLSHLNAGLLILPPARTVSE
jgi:hypothetical protein